MAALAMIWLLSSALTRFSPIPIIYIIPFRNFLNDCLVWKTRPCSLMEKRKRAQEPPMKAFWSFVVLGHSLVLLLRLRSFPPTTYNVTRLGKTEFLVPFSCLHQFAFRKRKLRNMKVKLDDAHVAGLTKKQRRTSARVNRTEDESPRPHPTNGPRWAVRSD